MGREFSVGAERECVKAGGTADEEWGTTAGGGGVWQMKSEVPWQKGEVENVKWLLAEG